MPDDKWRETVRDIYDDLHFGEDNVFDDSRLAARLVALIEARHPEFFGVSVGVTTEDRCDV